MQETKSKNILETEAAFMQDFWEFRKNHYRGGEWDVLVADVNSICGKYKNLYVELMMCLCVADIESRATGSPAHLKHMLEVIRRDYGRKD